MYAAATELQRIWTETVATPVRRLPAAEQLISLHEPGGRLSSFVSGPLSPFLDADKSRPLKLMGEALPLSPAFLALLGDARQIGMILSGDGPPHPIRIKLGHTALDGGASLVEEKTSVTVACTGNTIRLSSPGQNFGIVPWSYQECTDANLSVVFVNRAPSEGRADRYALTRRYPGRTGFISFINDFASGPKQFTLEEFAGADPAAGDLINDGLRALKISVQVETPAALASLLTQLQSPLVTDILPPLES